MLSWPHCLLDAESFPACLRVLRESYLSMTFNTMEMYSNFSKISERLYLIIRFACYPDTLVDINRDNRWNDNKGSMIKSVK